MEDNIVTSSSVNTVYADQSAEGSFVKLLRLLRRFIVLIIAVTVLGTAVGLAFAFLKDKTVYTQSKAVIVIAKIDGRPTTTNISLTNKYMETIQQDLTTPIFVESANDIYRETYSDGEGGLDEEHAPYKGISAGAIGVTTGDGIIITLSYSDYDAKIAADKLEAFIAAAENQIKTKKYIAADQTDFVSIQSVPDTSSSNGFWRYLLLGVFGGAVLGVALALLISVLDNTVKSKEEIERLTECNVIGFIENF